MHDPQKFEREEREARMAARKSVRKQIDGDQSKARSWDIEDLDRKDSDSFPNRGQRSGDGRVLPTRGSGLVDSMALTSAGPNTVPAGDGWLDRGEGLGPNQRPLSGYVYAEPDVDRRDEASFPGERSESGMAEPGVYRPSRPGDVGGTPASSFTVKSEAGQALINSKKGIFKSVMLGGTRDGVQAAADFLNSRPEEQ